MRHDLRDAVLNHLYQLMDYHMARGRTYEESIILGIGEIRRQLDGTRLDLATSLVNESEILVRAWNKAEARFP